MAAWIVASVLLGAVAGNLLLAPEISSMLDLVTMACLAFMVFAVGIEIGRNRDAWQKIYQKGWRVIIVPITIAVGSLSGAALTTWVLQMPLKEVLAVSAGFGWYSLSGVMISQLYKVDLGTMAFLANIFRELLAFICIPILVKRIGKLPAISLGGATTMDSTLPLIMKVTDSQTALIAFLSGLVLSAMVPILVPFILKL